MRYSSLALRSFSISACLLAPTIFLQAQTTPPPAVGQGAQGGQQAPGGGRGGRGGMAPSSDTPLAETENLGAYPAAPEGFNVAREGIPHGEVSIVEYDSKTLGLRRMLRVYTPANYGADRRFPVLYLHHGLGNTSTEWTQRAPIIIDNLRHVWRVDTNGHDTAEMSNSLYHFAQLLFRE
jgi:hypothetical protein